MSFETIDINKDEWTLVANNVTDLTFQNLGQFHLYLNFSSDSNTSPTEETGLVYPSNTGELKKAVTELTYKANPNYVWAKTVSRTGKILVESS